MRGKLIHQRLRAPRNSGETLIIPSLTELPQLLESNRQALCESKDYLAGHSLPDLRGIGKAELTPLAVEYTRSYRDIHMHAGSLEEVPLIVSGHQPQLFHPGVWFKNFALAACWQLPAISLNMIIDNDTCLRPSIRVPAGSVENPYTKVVPYDTTFAGLPFEERTVRDQQELNSFGQRVAESMRPFVAQPLVNDLWPLAIERIREVDNLGLCISQARHKLEELWGLNTLELPLSSICQTNAFRLFTVHLLSECERLRTDYNSSLAEYRQVNRIRSHSHPVPELTADDEFFETPFWIWTKATPIRRRLYARRKGADLYLTDRDGIVERIEAGLNDLSMAARRLGELEKEQGLKIRPRALTTTMFARLVLSDVFFHGIGGAKYDQLTDEIVRRFFGFEPPGFVTMTATAHLPLSLPGTSAEDVRAADQELRHAEYHPERFLDNGQDSAKAAALVAAKRDWIGQSPPRGQRRLRHREIQRINAALRGLITEQREKLEYTRNELRETLRRKLILASREYSYCLFPKESFDGLLLALS